MLLSVDAIESLLDIGKEYLLQHKRFYPLCGFLLETDEKERYDIVFLPEVPEVLRQPDAAKAFTKHVQRCWDYSKTTQLGERVLKAVVLLSTLRYQRLTTIAGELTKEERTAHVTEILEYMKKNNSSDEFTDALGLFVCYKDDNSTFFMPFEQDENGNLLFDPMYENTSTFIELAHFYPHL